MKVSFIEKNNLEILRESGHKDFSLAYYFMKQYIVNGTKPYISNADHEAMIGIINEKIVPLIINHGQDSTCYLTAPSVQYIKYSKDFLLNLKISWLRSPLLGVISLFEQLIRKSALDKVVYINHWAMPTGPQFSLSIEEVDCLLDSLKARYQDYAFVIKGLRQEKINELRLSRNEHKLQAVFNRHTYMWSTDMSKGEKLRHNFKIDRKHLMKNFDKIQKLDEKDSDRVDHLVELYNQLYIKKYSRYSPDLTRDWFSMMLSNPLMEIYGITLEEKLAYFATCFVCENELVFSVIGHQEDLSKQYGLYRMGVSFLMWMAEKRNKILNLSSGSGKFKLSRGTRAVPEYELVCFAHLPCYRRMCWLLISRIYNFVAFRLFTMLHI